MTLRVVKGGDEPPEGTTREHIERVLTVLGFSTPEDGYDDCIVIGREGIMLPPDPTDGMELLGRLEAAKYSLLSAMGEYDE